MLMNPAILRRHIHIHRVFILLVLLFLGLPVSSSAGLAGEKTTGVKRLSAGELRDVVRGNKGKVLILSFWSTLSSVSKQEITFLNELYGAYNGKALEIIAVNVEGAEPDVIAPFVEMMQIKCPVFVGGDDIIEEYDIQFIPVTFILGRDGKVQTKEIGFGEETKPKLSKYIDKLLAEE